jgi:dUTP pyrophosphatase
MELQIKRLTETAKMPTYAHATDSGMDLYYDDDDFILSPGDSAMLSTGIAIKLPPNTEAQIRSRSGLAAKHGISITHGVGTIDEGYTGEIKVLLINHGQDAVLIKHGDRIAQMVICPVLRPTIIEVDDLGETDRGANGFGSTGA